MKKILFCMWLVMAYAVHAGIYVEPKASRLTPFVNGQYRALVIGNNHYRSTDNWPDLKTAVTDAQAVAHLLKEYYGFQDVQLLLNAGRTQMLKALEKLATGVQARDSVLVYYAGHGYLDEKTGLGYWVPVDARGMDKSTFLRNSTVRDELTVIARRAQHTLLISDSCFSGSLLRGGVRGAVPENGQAYYKKVAGKKSVQVIAAGGLEYVDDNYGESGHSPFTYFLLNELKSNNQPLITAGELSETVKKAVANNVDQVPAAGVMHGAGDELGEFIFLNVNIKLRLRDGKVKVEHVQVRPADPPSERGRDMPLPPLPGI